MNKLYIALKKQHKEILYLKDAPINEYIWNNGLKLLCFNDLGIRYSDGTNDMQKKIDEKHYKSIEDFDSYHTADIEFSEYYCKKNPQKYENGTKKQLIMLAEYWRKRVKRDFPKIGVKIVVHREDNIWTLDTFNHNVNFNSGIFI